MADFYTRMRDKVSRPLLAKYKTGEIYLVRTAKTSPAGRPWDSTAGAPSRTRLDAVAIPVERKHVNNTQIVSTDTQVTFAPPVDVVPTIKDEIEIDGSVFRTIAMKRLPDAGVIVAYIFFVRH